MRRVFILLLVCIMTVMMSQNVIRCSEEDSNIKNAINQLRSKITLEKRNAIITLYKEQKLCIPYLIESIDNVEIVVLNVTDPRNSNRHLDSLFNYAGIINCFVIEFILAKDNLIEDETKDPLGLFSNLDNYIYWYGMIERNDKKQLQEKDMCEIKKWYSNWWEKNKEKNMEELRNDWKNGKGPLYGSIYSWN